MSIFRNSFVTVGSMFCDHCGSDYPNKMDGDDCPRCPGVELDQVCSCEACGVACLYLHDSALCDECAYQDELEYMFDAEGEAA